MNLHKYLTSLLLILYVYVELYLYSAIFTSLILYVPILERALDYPRETTLLLPINVPTLEFN